MATVLLPPFTPKPAAPPTFPPSDLPRRSLLRQDALFWSLALVFLLLRVGYAFIQRVNSDEPQHLHVAWEWTQGLLPYRDFFDNHTPLFGWLCAPLLRVVGERAGVVIWMRLAMVPLYLVGLWFVYRISRSLFPPRVACWTPLLAGLYPSFFFVATEFRTDALWCVLWLAAVATLVGGPATPRRAFGAGLLLGTDLGVSLKTVLMLATLALAGVGTVALRGFVEGRFPGRPHWLTLAAGLSGLLLVPGLIAAFFAAHGSWTSLVACTVGHNHPASNPFLGNNDAYGALRWMILPLTLIAMVPVAVAMLRSGEHWGTRRTLVLLTSGIYGALLLGFWPALTRQSYLPLYPLAAVPVVAAGWGGTRWLARVWRWGALSPWWLPGIIAVVEVTGILAAEPPWINHAQGCVRQIGIVLRLTDPGEFVMDAKGASVFRPRPFFPVLETFTMRQIRLGWRRDDIVERLVSTGTPVVIPAGLTDRSQAFVSANYLPVGAGVGAAGKRLPEPSPDGETRFEVGLPAPYVLLTGRGAPLTGWLDGEVIDGQPLFLAAGPHRFRPLAVSDGTPVLLWAQAYARGFLPVANWSVKTVNPDGRAVE